MNTKPLTPTDEGFIYVAGRAFYRIVPLHPSLPEAMTQGKGATIVDRINEPFELAFDSTSGVTESGLPKYERYAATTAVLRGSEWQIFNNTGEGATSLMDSVDGFFTFKFVTTDMDFLKLLCDRRDPFHGHKSSFDRYLFHWGFQDWGGLAIEISLNNRRLFRTEVDVFSPRDTENFSGELYFRVVSVDPKRSTQCERTVEKDVDESDQSATNERVDDTAHQIERSGDSPVRETMFVGKCRTCGAKLTLDTLLYDLIHSQGGHALVPCKKCKQAANVKLLSAEERLRKGYIAEVIS